MAKKNRNFQSTHRDEVMARYNSKCANCGTSVGLELHHIVPLHVGGNDVITNLVPLCHRCHMALHHEKETWKYKLTQVDCGRKNKVDFDTFSHWFDKYIGGEIGKKKFCEMTGYGLHITQGKNPHLDRAMKERGILFYKNNIDIRATNSTLEDGDFVGYVEYEDGRKEQITYHDTGLNDVEYSKRRALCIIEFESFMDDDFEVVFSIYPPVNKVLCITI